MKFHTRYSHPVSEAFKVTQPSLTQQCFAAECDINNIAKGLLPATINNKQPIFGSTISPDSYNEALNLIANASSQFEELPSHIRAEFKNDPKELISFMNDSKNKDKAIKLGFIEPEKPAHVQKFELVNKNLSEVITEPSHPVISQVSSSD